MQLIILKSLCYLFFKHKRVLTLAAVYVYRKLDIAIFLWGLGTGNQGDKVSLSCSWEHSGPLTAVSIGRASARETEPTEGGAGEG